MDTNAKIRQLMDGRGWTEYRLAKEAGLSQSTISNLFKRNTIPSIATLESICAAMGITLAQFFAQGHMFELTDEQKDMFDIWARLTVSQKKLLNELIHNMK